MAALAKVGANPVVKAIGPGSTHSSASLYDRIGGEKKLDSLVDDVYKDMLKDKVIGKHFARFRLDRLKDRTVDYLRGEWGGNPYVGPDLWISHSHMGIKNEWYDIMMKYYKKRCAEWTRGIGKQETIEILESLEKMRGPVCDPGQKFKNMYLKYNEQEAAKMGGDGWGMVAVSKKDRAEKERMTLEMIAKAKQEDMLREAKKKMDADAAANAKPKEEDGGGSGEVSTAAPDDTPAPQDDKANAPDAKAEPARTKPKPKVNQPDPIRFVFAPMEDEPPAEVPSSAPSGAELLYRLSSRRYPLAEGLCA